MTTSSHPVAPFIVIRNSDSEWWHINVREFRGQLKVDMQLWFRDRDGSQKPSSKGHVSIRPELIGQIVPALMQAATEAQRR